jgi:predicted kinase
MTEVVVLVGLPGAGKTTFYRSRFAATHEHVSKDNFPHARDREARQSTLIASALTAGRSVVVDNTNPRANDRRRIADLAHAHNARTIAYVFDVPVAMAIARNESREGRARVPKVAIFTVAKRFEPVTREEGFDEVADWFEAPLRYLLDPINHSRHSALFQGRERHYYEILWEGRRIWGATAAIIVNLSRRLKWA